ncbi:unnamed protein product [Bursaphelenchus okinawaensis]|uniref:NADAR domain-containing protein n=1 Tax=Bursaphelenchus okinawaensis TaxID=465554 RepID=A0A811K030_9BILA|nr:unnamed protein product [Bursaphelenchus okinawaensis]CAG9088789.1 unnamed protein product [Bursaphelenchus okinawaensis]
MDRVFSERDRLPNGKLFNRFEFSKDRLHHVFDPHGFLNEYPVTSLVLTTKYKLYGFSNKSHEFTPENRCKIEVFGETFKSVKHCYDSFMFRELCGVDPPADSDNALNLIERNVSTKDWEEWVLKRGMLCMQMAILERAKCDKMFRSKMNSINDRMIVYRYRNDTFYGVSTSAEELERWHRNMAENQLSITFPTQFPITHKQLHGVPNINKKGRNVLGIMLMALRETQKRIPLDDIEINLEPLVTMERPISFSTRLTQLKRIHGAASTSTSLAGSRLSLNTIASEYQPANILYNGSLAEKRCRFESDLFETREGTPCTLMGDMNCADQSDDEFVEVETKRLVIPKIQYEEEEYKDGVSSDDEVTFLGEVPASRIAPEKRHEFQPLDEPMEEKPSREELAEATNEPRKSLLWNFPAIFDSTARGRASVGSCDSGHGSNSTLNRGSTSSIDSNGQNEQNQPSGAFQNQSGADGFAELAKRPSQNVTAGSGRTFGEGQSVGNPFESRNPEPSGDFEFAVPTARILQKANKSAPKESPFNLSTDSVFNHYQDRSRNPSESSFSSQNSASTQRSQKFISLEQVFMSRVGKKAPAQDESNPNTTNESTNPFADSDISSTSYQNQTVSTGNEATKLKRPIGVPRVPVTLPNQHDDVDQEDHLNISAEEEDRLLGQSPIEQKPFIIAQPRKNKSDPEVVTLD